MYPVQPSELTDIYNTIKSTLYATMTRYRDTRTDDGYGHTTVTPDPTGLVISCLTIKPTANELQAYAAIIGAKWGFMVRCMYDTDIKEGDRIVYDGKTWIVNAIQNAESYTVTLEFFMTAVV